MFEQYESHIRQQAIEAYPLEAVWLITEDGCRHVENIHEDPENFFSISEADSRYAMARGLLAVVHSHPSNIAAPSASDMQSQINTAVPWGIVGTDGVDATRIAWWGNGTPKQPLVGRQFRHGISDCYSLIRDYYEEEKGVDLLEFPRDWEWWKDQNLLVEGFPLAGFTRIDASEAEPGDVWLAQIASDVACHCGILLEDSLALHQVCSRNPVDDSRLSVREPIFRYQRYITHWLRYTG